MGTRVSLDIDAKDQAAVRAFIRLENKTDNLRRKQEQLHQGGKRGQAGIISGLGKWATGLGVVLGGYQSIKQTVQLVGREIDANQQRQERFARTQGTLASAQQDVIRNMTGVPGATVKKYLVV